MADEAALLMRDRARIAADLVKPIAYCVQQNDTRHSAFRGCIDWHSAVHGTWALIAYMRATGGDEFDDLVQGKVLTPELIAAERAFMQLNPRFEMPYGRAWFLRLAIDYEKRYADRRLMPMAEDMADSLSHALGRVPPDPWSGSYVSQSWAVLNLMDFAAFTGDPERREVAEALAQRLIDSVDGPCPIAKEHGDFMAICTNLVAIAARLLPPEQFGPWLAQTLEGVALEPVLTPVNAHHFGLNLSRAWGLWAIWQTTGDPRWSKLYAAHVLATYARPDHWSGDYQRVAHWVAQFGIYAIQPLFGIEKGR